MKKLLTIVLIAGFSACTVPEQLVVTNIQDLTRYPSGCSVYALPRTRLAVTITAVSYTTVPGPYSSYAEEFLGISEVPLNKQTHWELRDIYLHEIVEPDPDYYYSLESSDPEGLQPKLEELRGKGYITDPGAIISRQSVNSSLQKSPEPVYFTDLSINLFSEGNSERKKAKADRPVDLPVTTARDRGDSYKARAEEAAAFIIKIRKRRFKLLSGQYEVFPEGVALQTSVEELNRLEEEYLSLFIGKVNTDTLKRTFLFTPAFNQELEREELCRFSEDNGFLEARSASGRPVVLDIRNMDFTRHLKQVQLPLGGPGHEGILLYRIPEKAAIKILYGSSTALEAEMKIYQYGATVPLQVLSK